MVTRRKFRHQLKLETVKLVTERGDGDGPSGQGPGRAREDAEMARLRKEVAKL